jgi:hypothetical protein
VLVGDVVGSYRSGIHRGAATPFPVRLSHRTSWVPTRWSQQVWLLEPIAEADGAGRIGSCSGPAEAGAALIAARSSAATVVDCQRRLWVTFMTFSFVSCGTCLVPSPSCLLRLGRIGRIP